MRDVKIVKANPYNIEPVEPNIPEFTENDYVDRILILVDKMKAAGFTHSIVYGDREHFSNFQYLTAYDPRFEEALLIISDNGELTLLVGNEGWSYSFISPLKLNRILYQNFSLQGQPRQKLKALKDIFTDCKIKSDSKIGIIGFKYFEAEHIKNSEYRLDIPSYIVDELTEIVSRDSILNFTQVMTHPVDGIRMIVRTPKEIAHFEYACNKVSNCMINLIRSLIPGIGELEITKKAGYDASPISMFPIANFGEEHVKLGLRSPDHRVLEKGDVMTLCYAIRGCLIARSGLAVYDEKDLPDGSAAVLTEFYRTFFRAVVEWYESLKIGACCGDIFNRVMTFVGDEKKFRVALNPGHNIEADEWTNSPFFKDSQYKLLNGYYLQSDIIASADDPFRQGILEDGIILADEALKTRLKNEYPEVYDRIQKRREFMKNILGITLSEDVLPLSNTQAVYHPYMLDSDKVFVMAE